MHEGAHIAQRASGLLKGIIGLLEAENSQVLVAWPFERYMACLDRYPKLARLGYRSPEVHEAAAEIARLVGLEGLDLYNRGLLLALITRTVGLLPHRNLPDEIVRLYEENYDRIIKDIEATLGDRTRYRYPLSPFLKDLALCMLRLIPAGVEKVNLSRLPRRMFLTAGLRGGLDALRFVLLERRGLRPYYEMHLHSQDLKAKSAFTPRGWTEFFIRIADLLRRNPEVKGVFGTAWFRDPALATISPHLAPARTIMTDNGARIYCLGRCKPEGVDDATSTSRTRRRLYEQGLYTPKNYLVVWPREALIAWADAHPELRGEPGPAPLTHAVPAAVKKAGE